MSWIYFFHMICEIHIILCKMRFIPYKVRLNQTSWKSKNSKFQFGCRDFWQLSYYWLFWIAAITKIPKSGNYDSRIQDRDLQQKPNIFKFGSIFNFNCQDVRLIPHSLICMRPIMLSACRSQAHTAVPRPRWRLFPH